RRPRILSVVRGDAVREFARIAERGHTQLAGTRSADVGQDQLKRASEGRVRARDIAEDVAAAGEPEITTDRAVDDYQWRGEVRRRLHAMNIESLVAGRADQWYQHSHHFRLASCHHRIGRDLFHRG